MSAELAGKLHAPTSDAPASDPAPKAHGVETPAVGKRLIQLAALFMLLDVSKPTPRLLLNSKEAAAALAISERLLWSLTRPRGDLPFVKIGRAKRYDLRDLLVIIDRLKVRPSVNLEEAGPDGAG